MFATSLQSNVSDRQATRTMLCCAIVHTGEGMAAAAETTGATAGVRLCRLDVLEQAGKARVSAICVHPAAEVPLRIMVHLPELQLAAEGANMAALQAFWRARGCAIPRLVVHRCTLDVHEALRQVTMRGGFWACSAAQVCAARRFCTPQIGSHMA